MEEKYKYLDHTADIKFQAFGKDMDECFANAGYALTNIISKDKIKSKTRKKIKIQKRDVKGLLYDFLEEFLYLLDVGNFIVSEIKNLKVLSLPYRGNKRKYELTVDLYGDDIENYQYDAHVKAITYDEMFVKRELDTMVCQVVIDI